MTLTEPKIPIDLPVPDAGLRITSTYRTTNGTRVIQKHNTELIGRVRTIKALRAEIGIPNRKAIS